MWKREHIGAAILCIIWVVLSFQIDVDSRPILTTEETRLAPTHGIEDLISDAKIISKSSLSAGTHKIIATIYAMDPESYEREMLIFRLARDGRVLGTMKANGFKKPVVFRYDGKNFLYVCTEPEGSGAFVTETVFWIAPDGTLQEIDLEPAAESYESEANPEETVLTGGPSLLISGGELRFRFYIANDGDPHCCPTAGMVTGNYRMIGEGKFDPATNQYHSTFRMIVDQYSREPLRSDEVALISE